MFRILQVIGFFLSWIIFAFPALASEGGGVVAADEDFRVEILTELNRARVQVGQTPVELHPVLDEVALWRASVVAASGSTVTEVATINEMTRRIRGQRYNPFHWTQSVIIGGGSDVVERLRVLNPTWHEKATTGDFEHAGFGLVWRGSRPVVSLVLAIRKHTVDWRRARPLADLESVSVEMLAAVNAARLENGRADVELEDLLSQAAQRHAEDMLRRAYYAHRSPEGETAAERLRAVGYRSRGVAENIAKGPFGPEEVVLRWLDSSGHRRNILRPKARRMGVGVAFGDNANGFEVLWVQVFAGDR